MWFVLVFNGQPRLACNKRQQGLALEDFATDGHRGGL